MQKLKNRFLPANTTMDDVTTVRAILALATLPAMFLPWATLDGASSSLTGSHLITYALTSPERGFMISQYPASAVALFILPIMTLVTAVLAFLEILKGKYPLIIHTATVLMPLVLTFTTRTITSSDQPEFLGIPMPAIGPYAFIFIHSVLLAHGLYLRHLHDDTPNDDANHHQGASGTS